MPLAALKTVDWHGLPQRAVFFWQIFFIELLSAPSERRAATVAPLLAEPQHAPLRDGAHLFLTRHLKKLVHAKHPELAGARRELAASLDVSDALGAAREIDAQRMRRREETRAALLGDDDPVPAPYRHMHSI